MQHERDELDRDPDHGRPSFDEWVTEHIGSLQAFALIVCGNPSDADDALQEALVRAYTRWVWVSRTRDPLRYVRRMIANAHASLWRKHHRRETPTSEVLGLIENTTSPPLLDLTGLLLRLTPQQRIVVALRYLDDLSFTEISATLRMPEATARSHHARALKTLQTSPREDYR